VAISHAHARRGYGCEVQRRARSGDSAYSTWVVVVVFAAAFAINGVIGHVVEELYFRGYLVPRIDRFGRALAAATWLLAREL
jgi:membrane protease YdiL (CAAX protease family)